MANKKPLLIAVIFGIIAVVLVYVYMKSMEDKYAEKEAEYGTVVLAAETIQVRQRIKDNMIVEVEWLVEYIPKNAYTELEEVLGKISSQVIYEGGTLFPDQFKDVGEVGDLAVHLEAGERAITIGVTEIVAVGGNVKTGDHVDILVSFESNDEVGAPTTVTILRDVRVAAIGTDIGTDIDETGGKGISKSVTLAVNPEDAEKLTLASENGRLRLSLRPLDEPYSPLTLGITLSDIIRYRPTREDMKSDAAVAEAERRRLEDQRKQSLRDQGYTVEEDEDGGVITLPPFIYPGPTGPDEVTIEIIRGGEVEEVTVPESLYGTGYSLWPRVSYSFDSMHPMPHRGE